MAYPLYYIENHLPAGKGKHPKNVIFLTADATGVLPAVAKLDPEEAIYYFLSGYTSKLAGTERGIKEPKTTFSACFGAPFMPHSPEVYAQLLKDKLNKHGSLVYLVNTGWFGGPYGVGQRIGITETRTIISLILNNRLVDIEHQREAIFGLNVPVAIDGVGAELLNPMSGWENQEDYLEAAKKLKALFEENALKYSSVLGENKQ
ncbi:MAG: phosphoenolpyruvate carboxykinase (ATP) [Candidatus Shapirobacteria bacterium]|nr:phosphoenolpyruvate carboxykinase (ATP) [Candidatus Shapirobacteria bacterium]